MGISGQNMATGGKGFYFPVTHTPAAPFVLLGYVAKAHGVRGEVSIHSFAESPKLLLGEIFFGPVTDSAQGTAGQGCPERSALTPATVTAVRQHHGAVLVMVEGIDDRDAADALRRRGVFIARGKLPRARNHEVYLHDLLGLAVMVADPNGAGGFQSVGAITSIASPAGQELWSITTPEGKEILFPAVPEFVGTIDLDAGTVVITPPPGLIELYTSGE